MQQLMPGVRVRRDFPGVGVVDDAARHGRGLSSAFSAILVYAQKLMPGKVGMVSGLFFGFAFGMGGLGAAVLGWWVDRSGTQVVYQAIAYLPLLGVVAALLPRGVKTTG
jgi:FSR family fosmidomycin resistance protein-like MFS transporter